jgi:membrane dipeptidase
VRRRRGAIAVAWLAAALAACRAAPDAPAVDPALDLHQRALVVDTHSDTTPWFQDPLWNFAERHADGHEDLPRMREGGLDAQFWSIYLPEEKRPGMAIRRATERIEAVHRMVERHADETELARSVADIERIVAGGRIASLMGIEGGHIIEDSLDALREFYGLGARYMTLTHSFHTSWADSSGTNEVPPPLHGGLTEFGREVVREMNRIGMMVDVSHVSDDTFWDVLEVTSAPVIASHSSLRAVAEHPRNLSDAMLRALAENGGVVMINFYSGYIDSELVPDLRELMLSLRPRVAEIRTRHQDDPVATRRALRSLFREQEVPRASLDVVLDHFDHAVAVAGADHVGIGADWDGVLSTPVGLEDVSRLPALTRGLLERGHGPEVVRKVLGANLLRVMAATEAAREPGSGS